MNRKISNIVLTGMPGSGKSTTGVILSKVLSRGFIDTDILIQTRFGCSLQEIVDTEGHMGLRAKEEEVLLSLECEDHVIATGGSAVYSDRAMARLRETGLLVFLDVDLNVLESRVRNAATRGLAARKDQGIADLYSERMPLYRRWADITVKSSRMSHEELCAEIICLCQGKTQH